MEDGDYKRDIKLLGCMTVQGLGQGISIAIRFEVKV